MLCDYGLPRSMHMHDIVAMQRGRRNNNTTVIIPRAGSDISGVRTASASESTVSTARFKTRARPYLSSINSAALSMHLAAIINARR